MTDYAEPADPQEVCQRIEDRLRYKAEKLRRDAEVLIAKADALVDAMGAVFDERMLYDRHQPPIERVTPGAIRDQLQESAQ